MRHGKAEPYAATDHARELTARGRRDATDAGDYLAAAHLVPDYAVVSTAARTRSTWDEVSEACESEAEVVFDDRLYAGGVQDVIEMLHVVPEAARTVIFVGHNPTAAYLAHVLDDGNGETAAVTEMLHGYPTSALTVLEFDLPWSDLTEGAGRVRHFHVGRG